jgi:hypothetical protein
VLTLKWPFEAVGRKLKAFYLQRETRLRGNVTRIVGSELFQSRHLTESDEKGCLKHEAYEIAVSFHDESVGSRFVFF